MSPWTCTHCSRDAESIHILRFGYVDMRVELACAHHDPYGRWCYIQPREGATFTWFGGIPDWHDSSRLHTYRSHLLNHGRNGKRAVLLVEAALRGDASVHLAWPARRGGGNDAR